MIRVLAASLTITYILSTQSANAADAKTQEAPGVINRISKAFGDFFSHIGNYIHSPDETDELSVANRQTKPGLQAIKEDATVSENLHTAAVGPREAKTKKASVDLEALEDKISPLPKVEEISAAPTVDTAIRKEMAKNTELEKMKNESGLPEAMDSKIVHDMPPVKLATTLNTEKIANTTHSMNELESQIISGNSGKN
jgi:hypothetical protein